MKNERRKIEVALVFAVLFTMLAFVSVGCVSAAEWHVYPGQSIQTAINNAGVDDTIYVHAGAYTENVIVNKSLTLKGVGMPEINGRNLLHEYDLLLNDPSGDATFDIGRIWIEKGADLWWVPEPKLVFPVEYYAGRDFLRIYMDTDNNPATGYSIHDIGADYRKNTGGIESWRGEGWQFLNGWSVTGYTDCRNCPEGADIRYFFDFDDAVTGFRLTNATAIRLVFESLDRSTSPVTVDDVAPDSGSVQLDVQMWKDEPVDPPVAITVQSDDCIIEGFKLTESDKCGLLIHSNNSRISNNTITDNMCGVELISGNNNIIDNNTIVSNDWDGIYLEDSTDNIIKNNTISNNGAGVWLSSSFNNHIYNNYFDNTQNAGDDDNNIWNTAKTLGTNIVGGPFLGGNYWSDYTGEDLDGDGLGDTLLPYNSSGNIQNGGDWLPLVAIESTKLPDLTLSSSDISFSNPNPKVGETITITATIHNIGNADASNVVVQFFDGDPDNGGTPIGSAKTITSLPAGGSSEVEVDWQVKEKKYIYVEVDPLNSIEELNEENNYAVRLSIGIKELIVRIGKPGDKDLPNIRNESDVDSLIKMAKDIGAEAISISFKDDETGKLFYSSDKVPDDSFIYPNDSLEGYNNYTELLEDLIEKAHQNNIKIYAWIPIFNDPPLAQKYDNFRMWEGIFKDDGTYDHSEVYTSDGEYRWVNPVNDSVQDYELGIIEEILEKFQIDGVRLDHVRYVNDYQDMSPFSEDKLWNEEKIQFSDIISPKKEERTEEEIEIWKRWVDWRAESITSFFQKTKNEVVSLECGGYLQPHSARKDGYHDWSGSGQDYEKIGDTGIDVMPMVYWQDWTSRDKFEEWTYNKTYYSKLLSNTNVIPVFSITNKTNETYWGKTKLEDSELEMYLTRSSQITRNNDINEISLFYYHKWGSYETERAINSFSFHQEFYPIVDILSPKNGEENAAYAGAFGNPHDSIEVHIWVMDKNENECITGLSEDDFTFKIGEKEATATLINSNLGYYVFEVKPPKQTPPSDPCSGELACDLEVKVEIEGYGTITATETEAVSYSCFNRADAVYLKYHNVAGEEGRLISTDVKIDHCTEETFYCGLIWSAMGEATVGYYGIQSKGGDDPNKHVHFTVWDPPGKTTIVKDKPIDVTCEHTPTEGGGCVCTWDTEWLEGQDYKLIVKVSTNGMSTFYNASFYNYSNSELKHIATLEYPVKDKWIDAVSSFIEDFGDHPNCDAEPRSYLISNGWKDLTDGTSIELDSAVYDYNPLIGCKEHNAKIHDNWFKLETGNGIVEDEDLKRGDTIKRKSTLRITTTCSVDIEVINPEGKKTNKQFSEDPNSKYLEYYINDDNELDDEVIISVKKVGTYRIKVIPEPDAEPTDTYTLKVSSGDTTIVLAENVPISEIPDQPYIIRSTEEGIFVIPPTIQATIRIEPETLNLASKGVFTAFIPLPEGYNVSDINISTVVCEYASAIEGVMVHGGEGGLHGKGHIGDTLKVKFNRQDLVNVPTGDAVTLTVTGKHYDGTPFEGSDTIRVIDEE